ncbi:S-layer homology domain-containing protein [Paenalkalicoccus suaedae]|uniref:S-layer homology domain-containing protein n=1 Tax=Paenalkalicoccus suaedae TaxID=2592382 RepID=UPI003D3138C7
MHGDTDVTSTDTTFNDSEAVSPWAKDYVQLASDLSLVQGRANAMFAPKDRATRAENSQIIYNLLVTK